MHGHSTRLGFLAAAAGLAVAPLARAAAAAPDEDLAYLRLLVGVELLTQDFASRHLAAAPVFRQVRADDRAHYEGLAALLAGAGATAATADDIDFSYPSRVKPAQLGHDLASLAVGAYLGAVENVQTPSLRLPLGQIAANEAQHVSAFAQLAGRPVVGHAFATALSIDAVSAALDRYES